jgi:pentatricopeptide repeat protein
MARNCFRQGRVEDMIAMWVVMTVMTVTPTLV